MPYSFFQCPYVNEEGKKKEQQEFTLIEDKTEDSDGEFRVILKKRKKSETKYFVRQAKRSSADALLSNYQSDIVNNYMEEHVENKLDESKLIEELKTYRGEAFKIGMEILAVNLVRAVDPDCCPKYRKFWRYGESKNTEKAKIAEKEFPLIGSKYVENYTHWFQIFDENWGDDENPSISPEGYICLDKKSKKFVSIEKIGVCCVLRYVVAAYSDFHDGNWGLISKQEGHEIKMTDFKFCFNATGEEETVEAFSDISKFLDFVYNYYDDCLPQELCDATYVQEEVIETINKVKNILTKENIEKIGKDFFNEFPLVKPFLINVILQQIDKLDNLRPFGKELYERQIKMMEKVLEPSKEENCSPLKKQKTENDSFDPEEFIKEIINNDGYVNTHLPEFKY